MIVCGVSNNWIVACVVVILILCGYFFYWQPMKKCEDEALLYSIRNAPESKYPSIVERTTAQENLEATYYQSCIK